MESLWMSSTVSPFLEGDAWVGFRRRTDKAKMRRAIVVSRERISVLGYIFMLIYIYIEREEKRKKKILFLLCRR